MRYHCFVCLFNLPVWNIFTEILYIKGRCKLILSMIVLNLVLNISAYAFLWNNLRFVSVIKFQNALINLCGDE